MKIDLEGVLISAQTHERVLTIIVEHFGETVSILRLNLDKKENPWITK